MGVLDALPLALIIKYIPLQQGLRLVVAALTAHPRIDYWRNGHLVG